MKYKAKIVVTVEFEFDSDTEEGSDDFLREYHAQIDGFIVNVEGPEMDYSVTKVDTVDIIGIGESDEYQE